MHALLRARPGATRNTQTDELQLPRLVLVLHGRREERVRCRAEERLGVDFILPGVHGHPPVHHLHRIGAHRGNERAGKSCGARRFLRIGCGAKRCEIEAVRL